MKCNSSISLLHSIVKGKSDAECGKIADVAEKPIFSWRIIMFLLLVCVEQILINVYIEIDMGCKNTLIGFFNQ